MNSKKKIIEFIGNTKEHSTTLFLVLLLCLDLVFIALHSIDFLTSFVINPLYSVESDLGYPEKYQYLKWFGIVMLLVCISILRRSIGYCAWGLVFTYFLFDDAFRIHEQVGFKVSSALTFIPPLRLRPEDLGELAVSVSAGVILSPIVLWAYIHGSQSFKKISLDMLMLIFALAFFGVVVDMAHVSIQLGPTVKFVLGVIEDGGEMVVASIILWYVFRLSVCDQNDQPYLHERLGDLFTGRNT